MICGCCNTEPCKCPSEIDRVIYAAALTELRRLLNAAQLKSEKAAAARRALPAGSSRAKVTSVNAKWKRHAEERDRLGRAIAECERRLRGGRP